MAFPIHLVLFAGFLIAGILGQRLLTWLQNTGFVGRGDASRGRKR